MSHRCLVIRVLSVALFHLMSKETEGVIKGQDEGVERGDQVLWVVSHWEGLPFFLPPLPLEPHSLHHPSQPPHPPAMGGGRPEPPLQS
jgi:hypothetical protein